jgi:hypothetical protein
MQNPSRPVDDQNVLRPVPADSQRRRARTVNDHHLEALLARWKHGSDEAAAVHLKISRHTLKNLLYDLRTQIGAKDTTQATYLLREDLMRLEERLQAGAP